MILTTIKTAVMNTGIIRITGICVALLGACFAGPQPVNAQWEDIPLASVQVHGQMMPQTDISDTKATFSRQQASLALSLFTLSVDYTLDRYSWEKPEQLPFGNKKDVPWESLHELSASGFFGADINERWAYMVGGLGSAAFEEDLDTALLDGFFGAAAIYTLSDTLDLIGGAGVLYTNAPKLAFGDLFDDPNEVLPVPVLGCDWEQENEFGLFSISVILPMEASISYYSADGRIATSANPLAQTAELTYRFTPMLGTTLQYSRDSMDYRLGEKNPVLQAGTKEGYVHIEGHTVGLMLNVIPLENVVINAGPYYTLKQEISILDKADKTLHTIKPEDVFGGTITVSAVF